MKKRFLFNIKLPFNSKKHEEFIKVYNYEIQATHISVNTMPIDTTTHNELDYDEPSDYMIG